MMTGNRVLAFFLAACALAASAVIVLPMKVADTPAEAFPLPVAPPAMALPDASAPAVPSGAAAPAGSTPRDAAESPDDDMHAALPRLWLGSPIAR